MRTNTRRLIVAGAASAVLLIGGGVAWAGAGCHDELTEEPATEVEMTAMCFHPAIVHVDPGSTVEFVNRDPLAHNVIGYGVSWGRVENMSSGQRTSATFEEAGIYPFACTIHPGMVGAVVVGHPDSSTASSQPPDLWKPLAFTLIGTAVVGGAWHWSKPRRDDGHR